MDNQYLVEEEFPVYFIDCKNSFEHLTEHEKKYSFSLIKAGWYGGLIDSIQCSYESAGLLLLAQKLFRNQSPLKFEAFLKTLNVDESNIKSFFNYFAMVYGNLGNYRSFGDSKFIPRMKEDIFNQIILSSEAYQKDARFREIYSKIKSSIFSLTSKNKQMGLENEGISRYYSDNCTMDDAKLVQKYLDENNISPYNTRLFKHIENGVNKYEVRQASSLINEEKELKISNPDPKNVVKLTSGDYKELMNLMVIELNETKISNPDPKNVVKLTSGDYKELMNLMVIELNETKLLALNETEKSMIECYIKSFQTGSIDDHKEGSKYWIKDKGPVVENYIGFIESYRDPFGVRGEFETFIAVVNKEMSRKFEKLVNKAPDILKELPWPKQYEKDCFLQPDFTSLDIINFPVSGMPVGINIPNYDDIRQELGFKNVSLGNVSKVLFKDPKSNFIAAKDKEIFINHVADAFEVQVGLHELIGHGSGKLFHFRDDKYNFDRDNTMDILTNTPITNWYKGNETWDSVFTSIASPFEECRAECVGLYLCSLPEIADIFGFGGSGKLADIIFINWLSMMKASLVSMEFYTPEQKKWRQAHSQARFVILQVLLEAGNDFVKLEVVMGDDGRDDLVIHLDRKKIDTVGRPAIGNFLKRLQYYKSTAMVKEGTDFFNHYSNLNEQFLKYREIVLDRKLPRGVVIQCVINNVGNSLNYIEFPATSAGMIQSFIDRFSGDYGENAENALYEVWSREITNF